MKRTSRGLHEIVRDALTRDESVRATDAELVLQFAKSRDEAAFEEIVRRHGHVVSSVCRRILGDSHEAEDAVQATFLILARRVNGIENPAALVGWLHGVARRVATRTQMVTRKRAAADVSRSMQDAEPPPDLTWAEARQAIDAAVDNLPTKYKDPVVLYYLEGLTQEQTAERLGLTRGTLRFRLERGCDRIRQSLQRRGIALSVGLFAAALGSGQARMSEAAIRQLAVTAVEAASGPLPSELPAGVRVAMSAAESPRAVVRGSLAVIGGLLAAGVACWVVVQWFGSGESDETPTPVRRASIPEPKPSEFPKPMIGVSGRVRDWTGRGVPFAEVAAYDAVPENASDSAHRDRCIGRAKADAEGRFRFEVPADRPVWWPGLREVKLIATAPGKALGVSTTRGGKEHATADITLGPSGSVRGKLASIGGEPVSGATVWVTRLGPVVAEAVPLAVPDPVGEQPNWPTPVVSAADGTFEFRGIAPMPGLRVEVRDPRYAPAVFDVGGNRGEFVVRLESPRSVSGQAVDRETGQPVPNVRLNLKFAAPSAGGEIAVVTTTDRDGRFLVTAPPGEAVAYLATPGRDTAYLPKFGRGTTAEPLRIALDHGVPIEGKATDEAGVPVVNGCVYYYAHDPDGEMEFKTGLNVGTYGATTTDMTGAFRLVVPAGSGTLLAHGPTDDFVSVPVPVSKFRPSVEEGRMLYAHALQDVVAEEVGRPQRVEVRLRRGERREVLVLDPTGKPAGGSVFIRPLVHALVWEAARPTPILEGRLSLTGCDPGFSYPAVVLDPERRMGAFAVVPPGAGPSRIRLEKFGTARVRFVKSDGTPLRNFRPVLAVQLPPPGPSDRVDGLAARQPFSDWVPIHWIDPKRYPTGCDASAGDGVLTLRGLIPGVTYGLGRVIDGRRVLDHTVRVSADEDAELPDITIRSLDGKP